MPGEEHYDLEQLHKIFAIVSIILLCGILAMFSKDYNREWKKYQKEAKAWEVEKARVKLDAEIKSLESDPEYKELSQELDAEKSNLAKQQSATHELEQKIITLSNGRNIVLKNYQFAKAEYDALKYSYASAEEGYHGNLNDPAPLEEQLHDVEIKSKELKLQLEDFETKIKEAQSALKSMSDDVRQKEREVNRITQKKDLLEKKLSSIDPQVMSMEMHVANFVRDLPVLELANPNYKVRQVVLKDITDDVNLMRVPKVDRCMTCHVGIDNPDFEHAAQPLRTHPNLELFVHSDSSHPMQEFGCTTCHLGRGRATQFIDAAHTPSSSQQAKDWKEKHDWKALHHWDKPMYPKQLIQAGCFKCHEGQTIIKGAEKLNLGLQLIEKSGCYGCHEIDRYNDWSRPGPSLLHLKDKVTKEWVYKWIKNPQHFRHNAWMPSYFGQSNNNDAASLERSNQEIHAIVNYLFSQSEPFTLEKKKFTGDALNGEKLVKSIGCLACHKLTDDQVKDTTRDELRREHGPALVGLGSKVTPDWLYNWVKNPQKYHPQTRMPDMRLSDQEASDIVSFLVQSKTGKFDQASVPVVNEKILDNITTDFLTKSYTAAQSKKKLSKMSLDDKLQFAGAKLVRHYGCFACHDIKGMENEKNIGVELTEIGNKSLNRLDFGFTHIDHTKHAWFAQKLKNPRAFDEGKVLGPYEKSVMPNFNFTDQEVEAIVTALMGFVKDRPAPEKMTPRTPENLFIEEGQKLVRQFNCNSCHIIEDDGGSIKSTVTQWLMDFEDKGKTDAVNFTDSFSPPNLHGLGKKLQPKWLHEFLDDPEIIRPWLSVRMPSYHFDENGLNALVKYFNYLDRADFPFAPIHHMNLNEAELDAGAKLFSEDYFACTLCHVVGDDLPSGTMDSWAPNLALAKERLRPDWIIDWIKDPPALMPGTKMPAFYDPQDFDASGPEDIMDGDENEQIRVLRDYLMTLSEHKSVKINRNVDVKPAPEPAMTE